MRYYEEDGVLVTVFKSDERQGGLVWALRQGWSDFWGGRHVIVRLFLRDFVAQFRQKLLGYFWAILSPLFGILSYLYLYFTGVLTPGVTDMPYTLYVLIGSNTWAIMTGTMGAVSGGLQNQADLIMRTNIPKLSLAISSLSGVIYGMLISMITTGIVFLLYRVWPSPWFVAYPLLVLPLLTMGVAMGLVLSVLGVIAKDFVTLFTQGIGLLMYITPIVYLPEKVANPVLRVLIAYNPFTYLVDVPRSLIFHGSAQHVAVYLLVCGGILGCFVLGLRVFYLISDLVAERL